MTETALIPLEAINAVEVFTGGAMDDLLERIRQETVTLVPDVSTPTGRKEIASIAYKVARSKTTIDEAGKQLVADWKARAAKVDEARRKARDYLDALKDEVRKPLTEWEEEQARVEREAQEKARLEREAEERRQREELERREAELRAREEAIAKAEAAAAAKEAAEKAERERAEREERIRREVEERARREAEEAVERERKAAERAQEEARLAVERAERERAEAFRAAEERAKREAEERELARQAEAARQRAEDERRAADIENRRRVNNAALGALVTHGIDDETAKRVITLIASGQIPAVSIRY